MTPTQITDQAQTKFQQAVAHFRDELKKIRTGRAHAGMLDGIMVEAYGTPMPLVQLATVSAPEAQLLQITPFDPTNLQAISSAIRENPSLGLNPSDDGRVVRVPIPALSEERRRELAKLLGGKIEDSLIRMRAARHEGLHEAEEAKKNKNITEDDVSSIKKQLDEQLAQYKAEIEVAAKVKEQEIMTV